SGVKMTSLGDYRLFAYYSVPNGAGPFPAIYHAPGYASVVQVPPYEERRRHAGLSVCARGQRLSDRPYAAAFPGLLTDHIDYVRAQPDRASAVRATLDLFDPAQLADRVRADVLITFPPGSGPWNEARARRLADMIGTKASVYARTGKGYVDRHYVEGWIAEH